MRLQPVKFTIARHSRVFSRRQFLIWPRILIIKWQISMRLSTIGSYNVSKKIEMQFQVLKGILSIFSMFEIFHGYSPMLLW